MLNFHEGDACLKTVNGTTYLVQTEVGTGKQFAKIAAVMPSLKDPVSIQKARELLALDPVFVECTERGWYVPIEELQTAPTEPLATDTSIQSKLAPIV